MGCRRVAPQDELVRVIRRSDGTLEIGRTLPGRGAWLCAGTGSCVDLAAKRNRFTRALRGAVGPEAVERLRVQLAARARMGPPSSADGSTLDAPAATERREAGREGRD